MTKINKKQFYVISGLVGIIATAAFAFPLQTAESAHIPCPEGFVALVPDGICIPLEFCMEFDTDEHCTAQGDPPVLCPPGFVVLVPDRICIPLEFCMKFNDEEQCTAQGDPPVLCPPGFVVLVPDRICIPLEFCMEFNDEEQCTAQGVPPVCEPVHWDKIIFKIKLKGNDNKIFNTDAMVMPGVLSPGFTYDVKVLDDPETVAELEAKVRTKLNDLGYRVEKKQGNNIFLQEVARTNIEIIDVEYAIVCIIPTVVEPEPPSDPPA